MVSSLQIENVDAQSSKLEMVSELHKKLKKMEKMEKEYNKKSKKEGRVTRAVEDEIEPPRLHRDMRLICDVFRISEQTRYALRRFDAATLEDFSLMSDEDFADLVVTQARVGHPLPPLQQRKLRVLLWWVQSIAKENVDNIAVSPTKAEGFELRESKTENGDVLKASYKTTPRSEKESVTHIPAYWESRLYSDLPRLKKELRQAGKEQYRMSNWASSVLSLRWLFCGSD